jgi:hypothetical protein
MVKKHQPSNEAQRRFLLKALGTATHLMQAGLRVQCVKGDVHMRFF